MQERGAQIIIKDLRMGQEPNYTFSFAVAERKSPVVALAVPEKMQFTPNIQCGSKWLWRRLQGEALPTVSKFCEN